MSYKALLFCPDEKTARVVTLVLSDLEFHVEPCNEPFAAVKKLMAEHFDAIVVDCENEQNSRAHTIRDPIKRRSPSPLSRAKVELPRRSGSAPTWF